MGEFLSTPIKDKVSEDGENSIVKIYFLLVYSFDLVHVGCRDGVREWKMPI